MHYGWNELVLTVSVNSIMCAKSVKNMEQKNRKKPHTIRRAKLTTLNSLEEVEEKNYNIKHFPITYN